MLKILFVCTGNTCRSPMAEVLFNHAPTLKQLPYRVIASSAGISALEGEQASPQARELLKQENIGELDNHTSSSITREMVDDYDIILVMTRRHYQRLLELFPHLNNKTFVLREFAALDQDSPDIGDPLGHDLEKYLEVLEEIKACIKNVVIKLHTGEEN